MMAIMTERFVDLTEGAAGWLPDHTLEEVRAMIGRDDSAALDRVPGHFGLAALDGRTARLARTIGCPLRSFMAKLHAGPCLVVAERIDRLFEFCKDQGIPGQFDPGYTQMVPAHYLVELQLTGCPDPKPVYRRFFEPAVGGWPADVDEIGRRYLTIVAGELRRYLADIPDDEPVGVLFSGGTDSSSVLALARAALRDLGQPLDRLRGFTLAVGDGGADVGQARAVVERLGLARHWEVIEVEPDSLSLDAALATIEDYHPLDVQCAAAGLALLRGIRRRHPSLKYLLDGDGNDENLRSYPLEDSELTIRSVLNNPLLYQEGWGVDKLKHSTTYSGGLSRGYVRTAMPARQFGFVGFSPYTLRPAIAAAVRIPFAELVGMDVEKLYALKGQVVRAGLRAVTGDDLPELAKRRFQDGAAGAAVFARHLAATKAELRRRFRDLWESRIREVARAPWSTARSR